MLKVGFFSGNKQVAKPEELMILYDGGLVSSHLGGSLSLGTTPELELCDLHS